LTSGSKFCTAEKILKSVRIAVKEQKSGARQQNNFPFCKLLLPYT
jgi:hypothetical protein